jgi:hypothetical protein
MRKSALVALMLLALTMTASAVDHATGSFADAKAQAAKLGKPLLIDFFTEW